MRKLNKLVILIIVGLLSQLLSIAQISNVTNGFIANTFNGGNEKWVQNYAEELDVAPDGTMLTASEWDEAGRCIGVFKDGQPVTLLKSRFSSSCWASGTASKAVAINNKTIFVNNCEGNVLLFDRLNNYFNISKVNTGVAVGMTCNNNALYLIKADGVVQKRNLASLGTVALTFTVTGGYDLAVDTSGNIWVLTTNNEVLKYNALGLTTDIKIASQNAWEPSAVNYDAFNNHVLVSDNGPRRQVIKFNTLGVQVGTFGNEGGISAAPKGVVGDLRFWNIAGCGTDSVGNIYVALNENAVSLRKFNPNGIKQWEVQGLMFTDIASIDPASDGTHIYSINEKMSFDYKTQQWALQAVTCDRIRYPTDPRNKVTGTGISVAFMRRVNGNLLMFATGMYNDLFDVYYFKGEIAVYSQTIKNLGWVMFPDKNGNIWYESNSGIKKIPLTGFSENKPVFGAVVNVTASIPAPITSAGKLEYDVDNDVMYIGGYTAAKPYLNDGSWGMVGSTIARYPNWSTGNRVASNTVVLNKDVDNLYPKTMSVANDYIFVGGIHDRAKIYVYNSNDLSSVGYIAAPTNMGEPGWLDMPFAIQAYKRLNGTYAVLVEDNARGKNILYQWQPNTNDVLCDTIKVTSFTLNSKNETLLGSTPKYLNVNILPAQACRALKWESLNPNIVHVSANGKITGIGEGITQVVASVDNETISDTCTITVFNVPCTEVKLNKSVLTLQYLTTAVLIANITPTNALNKEVLWHSLNNNNITVNANGNVKALKMGTTTAVVVTSISGSYTDTCFVTIPLVIRKPYGGSARNIPGIIQAEEFDEGLDELSYHDSDVENWGKQFRQNVSVDIENCTDTLKGYDVGWTNADEWLLYYVNAEAGLYDITARVATPFAGSSFNLYMNDTLLSSFDLRVSGNWHIWFSANKFDIPITAGTNKTLKFLIKKGDFQINYLNFQKAIPISTFNITKDSIKMGKSTKDSLVVQILPSNTLRKAVKWKSSNTRYASVNARGVITAYNTDAYVTIYATSEDGKMTDSCIVTIGTPVKPIGIIQNANQNIIVYPNPVSDILYIANAAVNSNISIYSIEGKLIINLKNTANVASVNVSNWNKGLYILNISSATSIFNTKLIVE